MKIQDYTSYFHDGDIWDITQIGAKIIMTMESAEMDPDDMLDNIVLSKDDRIKGKLHIEGVRGIVMSKKPLSGTLSMLYDSAGIFDFEIRNNFVELSLDWANFPPKDRINEFTVIEIEAENVYWENIPDLINP